MAEGAAAGGTATKPLVGDALVKEVARVNRAAIARYEPRPYPGRVLVFRADRRSDHRAFYRTDPTNGWGALAAGGAEVITLPGHHLDLLTADRAPAAAAALRPYLAGGSR